MSPIKTSELYEYICKLQAAPGHKLKVALGATAVIEASAAWLSIAEESQWSVFTVDVLTPASVMSPITRPSSVTTQSPTFYARACALNYKEGGGPF